jgi:hypothetical protein
VQATSRRIGEGWCRRRESYERGVGFSARKWCDSPVFSTERACLHFSLVRTPQAHSGRLGMAWALRMDLGPFSEENE